jgi:hypothetical protein
VFESLGIGTTSQVVTSHTVLALPDCVTMSAQGHFPDHSGQITPVHEQVHDEKITTKLVQNAALSNATSLQKPSLLTWRMFMVCLYQYQEFQH